MSSIDPVLRYLAPSDANHDFGNDKPTTAQEMMAYNKALYNTPNMTIDYMDEGQCLASVVKNIPNYEPLAVANPDRDFCLRSRHLIETANGNNYTVYYADVKYTSEMKKKYNKESFADDVIKFNQIKNELRQKSNTIKQSNKEAKKRGFIADLKNMINRVIDTSDEPFDNREEIDAPMFYTMMGLNANETIAIVVDAASIGLIEILSTGTFIGVRPTVYYIFGPEVENDPATKKHPSSPVFKNPTIHKEGVIFIPCVSLNPSDFVYCYEYVPESELYLDKFFTNFKFELSELKENPKGKIIEYTTDLTIKSFDAYGKVKFIDESVDSKSKNDITFLTKIIGALKQSFTSGDEKEFQYAISFLKKMSGDWLQVLLTLAITNRTRGFTPYKRDTSMLRRENISKNIDRVFFVTHDRIALAFALLMGVECLFTHHAPVNGNPSLHSAFLYSLTDQAAVNASILEKALAVSRENKDYSGEIGKLTTYINEYNANYEAAIHGPERDLDSHLDGYLTTVDTKPTIYVNSFDKYVNNIFTLGLAIVATKKILPDLQTSALENIRALYTDLEQQKIVFATNITDVDKAKEILELNGKLRTDIANLTKIISNAMTFFDDDKGDGKMNLKYKIREFTKTLIYNAAQKWTWDSVEVNNRSLSKLSNMTETVKFNADRNIFLYNLDAMGNEYKKKIVYLFARCYQHIINNTENIQKFEIQTTVKGQEKTTNITPLQFNKFKIMATSFCYEVFYNFGGFYDNPSNILGYCDNIISINANITANSVIGMWDQIVRDQISENILLMEMNETDFAGGKQILDDGVDSFYTQDEENKITASSASASALESFPKKKRSTFDMKYNSVSVACKLLTSRLFSGRGIAGMHGGALRSEMRYSPSLPIQILLFQLSKTLKNENYYESGDFELVLQYYDFLLRMQNSLSEKNKDEATKIGLAIREFFFINNGVSEKNKLMVSTKLFNMSPKMLSFTGLLTTGFCGVLNETYFEDKESRKEIIEDPVFVEFINSIDVPNCFKTQYDLVLGEIKYSEFVDAVSKSAQEMSVTKTMSKTKTKTKTKSKTRTKSLQKKTRRKPRIYI